jgi:Ca2+-binding EF-hand superfamily protein
LSEDEEEILKKRTEYAQMKFNSFTNNTQLLNYKNLGVFIESKGLPKNETYLKNLIKKFDLNCDDQTDENEFVEMMLANKVEATVSEATLNTLQEEIDDKKLKELHQMLNKI